MNDRELLELAAKAAGIDGKWEESFQAIVVYPNKTRGECWTWNPLTDDGDAFRLLVKLNLLVDVDAISGSLACDGTKDNDQREKHSNDPYAATRRAIVRAAAEIGKSLP